MERFVKGDILVVQFPYTNFSGTKKRPAVVIATLRGENVILAQITTTQRNDEDLVSLTRKDFTTGRLNRDSFINTSLILTVDKSEISYKVGNINSAKIKEVEEKLCEIFTR